MKVERREGRFVLILDSLTEAKLVHEGIHAMVTGFAVVPKPKSEVVCAAVIKLVQTLPRFCSAIDEEQKNVEDVREEEAKKIATDVLQCARQGGES